MDGIRARITLRLIDATASPKEGELRIWDTDVRGFALRITPTGRKSYCLKYRYQGRQRWLTIGEHGSPWTPDTARSKAKEALYQASHGEDPQATKVETRLKSGTVKELFERYLVEGRIDKPLKRESSWKVDHYNYKRHIEPLLGKRVARELTLSDLSQFQAQVAQGKTSVTVKTKSGKPHAVVKGGTGAAARAMRALSTMMAWAVRHEILDQNLCGKIQTQLYDGARGTGQPNVNGQTLGRLVLPIPPLAEQHRIVAKVSELMVLCDRLESARATREAARDRLAAASLARLNAPNPESFAADAHFALNALPALTARPDQIKQLRQTILNLAVRGKLVPQDPKDEPASELLKRIAKERADLVRRKEIRRENPLDPISQAEMPFDVPATWAWSRIGEAVLFTQYGTSQKSSASEKGVPILTMGNIQDGTVVWNNEKRIPHSSEDLPALYLRKFDLLYNRTNSAELVGKTGIYLGDDNVRTFASYLIRLRPSLLSSNPRFLNMAMNTPQFRETQIVPLIKKQTGQANVNGTALKNMLIPVPPLAEQHRIVAKVDELMEICDRLEASLIATADTRDRLLDSLLSEALAPTIAMQFAAAE